MELKPCPFCGSKAKIVGSWLNTVTPKYKSFSVTCDGEKACMGQNMEQDEQGGFTCEFHTADEAIKAWNTRT